MSGSLFSAFAGKDAPQNPYAVFDERIYDQSILFARRPNFECLNDRSYQQAVLRYFTHKKIRLLEDDLFSVYDKELEYLSYLSEKYKPTLASKALKGGGQLLAAAAGLSVLAIPGVGEEIAAMRIFMATAAGVSTAAASMSLAHEFLQPDGNFDIDKLETAIQQKKSSLILNINKESGISDLEIEYILKKPFIDNRELQKNVEAIFIAMRKEGGIPSEFHREYIGNFLKLPLRKKQISIDSALLELAGKNPTHFNALAASQRSAAEELLNYEEEVKVEMTRLLLQIKYSSYSNSTSQRKFYYFFGEPGIGKTTAAKNIAQFLQLPLLTQSIRTGADLSETALEGQDWLLPGANTGFLARTLCTKIDEGEQRTDKPTITMPFQEVTRYGLSSTLSVEVPDTIPSNTYWNAVLLINDFDRILMDPSTTTQTISFFLDYLDPCKESFYSPYFKARIPIKDLIIVVTANYPIPSLTSEDLENLKRNVDIHTPEHSALKYRMQFQALKDRLVEIHFATLGNAGKNISLKKFLEEMCEKYHLTLTEQRKTAILTPAIQLASVRDAKKHIEKEVLDEKSSNLSDTTSLSQPTTRPQFTISEAARASLASYSYLTLPHLDEVDLQKQVKNLEKTNEYIKLFLSPSQEKQHEALKKLFGERGSIINPYANIRTLWKTAWERKKVFKEEAGGIQALANRLKYFDAPQSKGKIIRFHIQAAQVLLHALLKRAEDADPFVWQALITNDQRMANLRLFLTHLTHLSNLQTGLDQLTQSTIRFTQGIQEFLAESNRIINSDKQRLEDLMRNPAANNGDNVEMGELNPLMGEDNA